MLKYTFVIVDDSVVNAQEFEKFWRAKVGDTKEVTQHIFARFDFDKDGNITYDAQNMKTIFDVFDLNSKQ